MTAEAFTVSGPGTDVRISHGRGAAVSRAITAAERIGRETGGEVTVYVRDADGEVVARVEHTADRRVRVLTPGRGLDREAEANGGNTAPPTPRPVGRDEPTDVTNYRRNDVTKTTSAKSTTGESKTDAARRQREERIARTAAKPAAKPAAAKPATAKPAPAATPAPAAASAASPPKTETPAPAAAATDEGAQHLYDVLLGKVREAVEGVEAKPNPSGTYTRLLVGGKAFAYIYPPRKKGVALKIPKQLLGVAADLPTGHGFTTTGWGLTRTVTAEQDASVVAKALAVAAAAVTK